jgi:Cohesin domain
VAQTTGDVTLDIGEATGSPGGAVDVPVTIESTGTRPAALSFKIEFDATMLSYSSVSAGPAATDAGKDASALETTVQGTVNRRVNIVVAGSNQMGINDGLLLTVRFFVSTGLTQGQMVTLPGYDSVAAAPQNEVVIPSQIQNGKVTVGTCTEPSAPTGVTASDGDYADLVRISWNPVSGAAWYRVYRSATPNAIVATLVATVQAGQNYGEDRGATAAALQDSGGCGSAGAASFTTYYYWVQSLNSCGESAYAGPDTGFRGVGKAASKDFAAARSLPPASSGTPIPLDSPVAVRLYADEPINPASVRGVVTGEDFEDNSVVWTPARGDNANSGWVVYRPRNSWLPGELVALAAGAETVSGAPVGPVTAMFLAGEESLASAIAGKGVRAIGQPAYDEFDTGGMDLSAESQSEVTVAEADSAPDRPDLREGVGPVHTLLPQTVYRQPQRVWLPVPKGTDPSDANVYAFLGDDWFPAANVDGLLVQDSVLILDVDETTYLGFLARHGAVVQLGVPSASMPQTSAASAGVSWHDLTGQLVLVAFLLIILSAHRWATARVRAAD